MKKVLLPFTDSDSAERALRSLLEEVHNEPYEVELLAVAEPVDLSIVHRFVSPQRAGESARAAAACWIARLAPLLQAANVPYRTNIVVGNAPAEIEAALHRTDVDRVVLPAAAPRWSTDAPPVTLVA
jgi:universal stress protein family protein